MHDFLVSYYFDLKRKPSPNFLRKVLTLKYGYMKTIFPQYIFLRKHLQGHVLEANKNTLVILAYVRSRIKMKIRGEIMEEFPQMIQKELNN